jgi:adenosylcobinamide-GDP ribazoletransferase
VNVLRGLVAAFSHFSILPVPHSDQAPDEHVIGWLPLVGLVIGSFAAWGAYLLQSVLHQPSFIATLTVLALSIILSGALHVDGFLDCCDALFASASPERRLEILKDPHHGTFALVGMALLTLAWFFALGSIFDVRRLVWILPFVAMTARAAALLVAYCFPHARTGQRMPGLLYYFAGWVLAAFAYAHYWDIAIVPTAAAFFFALAIGWLASRSLDGGVTGDVYGAAIVVTEVAMLTCFSIPRFLP